MSGIELEQRPVSDRSASKTAIVLGLGSTGRAAVLYLLSRGYSVKLWDDSAHTRGKWKDAPEAEWKKAVEEGRLALLENEFADLPEAELLFVSPGVPAQDKATHALIKGAKSINLEIISDFDLFFAANPEHLYIGITGTNGKSTVTQLVYEMLFCALRQADALPNLGDNNLSDELNEAEKLAYALREKLLNIGPAVPKNAPKSEYGHGFGNEAAAPRLSLAGNIGTSLLEYLLPRKSEAMLDEQNYNSHNVQNSHNHNVLKSERLEQNDANKDYISQEKKRKNENYALKTCHICEISSYQLDLIKSFALDIAVCLAIGPDHLDRYSSVASYAQAKARIFNFLKPNSLGIVVLDSPHSEAIFNELMSRAEAGAQGIASLQIIPISAEKKLARGVSINGNRVVWRQCLELGELELQLPDNRYLIGVHGALNFAVAATVALAMGCHPEHIFEAATSFQGLPHRMRHVISQGDLHFINDSKATNCHAAQAALHHFSAQEGELHWIVGGYYKDANFESLVPFLSRVKKIYLIGISAVELASILKKYDVEYELCGYLDVALASIQKAQIKKGTVLFSPTCASQDQWKNFAQRGDVFEKLVHLMFGD